MSVLPTGTVTLLFTDIEGSTLLHQQLGERYGEVWAEHTPGGRARRPESCRPVLEATCYHVLMRRTLVQFDEETYRALRQRAFREERSLSSLVRDLVAKGLTSDRRGPPTHIRQLASVRAGRSKHGRLSPVSERHDEALAAAFRR
jgi:hypothetical protein